MNSVYTMDDLKNVPILLKPNHDDFSQIDVIHATTLCKQIWIQLGPVVINERKKGLEKSLMTESDLNQLVLCICSPEIGQLKSFEYKLYEQFLRHFPCSASQIFPKVWEHTHEIQVHFNTKQCQAFTNLDTMKTCASPELYSIILPVVSIRGIYNKEFVYDLVQYKETCIE